MTNKKAIIILITIGVIVRVLIMTLCFDGYLIFPDSGSYTDLAERITSLNLNGYEGYRSLGYPLMIAAAFNNLSVATFFQAALGILTSILWFKTLRAWSFKIVYALGISLFLSTSIPQLTLEMSILMESLVVFVMSYLVYVLSCHKLSHNTLMYNIHLSLIFGVLTLIKPFYAFIPFLMVFMFLLKHFKLDKALLKKSVIVIMSIVVYFSWSWVNKINTGQFVSSTFFGLYISQNCVRFAENTPDQYKWISEPYVKYRELFKEEGTPPIAMAIIHAYLDGEFEDRNLRFDEFSAELKPYAIATIKQNPAAYLKQVILYSWRDFWRTTLYWDSANFAYEQSRSIFDTIWKIQGPIVKLFRLLFLILSGFYLYKFVVKRTINNEVMLCLIVISASILQALITYGTNSRFSTPFEFIMIFVVLHFTKSYIFDKQKTVTNRT